MPVQDLQCRTVCSARVCDEAEVSLSDVSSFSTPLGT
jgi:hypothetical protein